MGVKSFKYKKSSSLIFIGFLFLNYQSSTLEFISLLSNRQVYEAVFSGYIRRTELRRTEVAQKNRAFPVTGVSITDYSRSNEK